MNDVAILDFNMGNLFSIKCALNYVGLKSVVTDDFETIKNSKCLIIPGVGAFPEAMKRLKEKKLDSAIYDFNNKGKVIIGICLGMQLLFSTSDEIKKTKGLNLIEGYVERFSAKDNRDNKVSFNVGWNRIRTKQFKKNISYVGDLDGKSMYFIHSYYVNPNAQEIRTSTSFFYNKEFTSSIKKNNIQGYQFHPEKSGQYGIQIYKQLKNELNK